MTKTCKLFLLPLIMFCQLPVFAQKTLVSGKISDSKTGAALDGVSVRIKASKAGTTTDINGLFSMNASANDVLEISEVGYETISVKVEGRSQIDIALKAIAGDLSEIVLVGSRGAGRVKTETAVPVDVVKVSDVSLATAKMDLTSILNVAAPSFNYNKQSGSDGADHIDLATLRGLGPDQTLVLINGKRRHQTAFIAVFGTRGRGNSGTDMNAFPESAIDRVEILRDGASAQYGSDAIAGVINLILKSDVDHFHMNVGYSGYNDPKFNTLYGTGSSANQYVTGHKFDGQALNVSADGGLPIGKRGGFIHLSGDFLTQGKTFRQVLSNDNLSTTYWSLPVNYVRRANGDGSVNTIGGFLNMEVPIAQTKTSFYAFGGYNYKSSDAYAFTRSFSARPDRFPTDASGNLIPVPGIIWVTSGSGGVDTVFNPHIQTHITDASLAAGFKGELKDGWKWDFSNTIGNNDFHFYGDKTFNASLGATKNHFDDGGFSFLQNTANLDFTKFYKGIGAGFNLAIGAEFRYEQYKLKAGEEASYKNYDATGNKATGSQGFPGYQPNDAIKAHRSNIALYIDGELDVTKKWLLDGAVRVENYSDFGFTSNYKLATRYKAADNFNIRGSISTGYRAPSLQQINFSSTFTTVQGGTIAEVKIAPNYSPITKAAGIPALKQEKSINASLGFAWKPLPNFSITVDGYYVQIKNRVVLSGQFDATDNTLDPSLLATMNQLKVAFAQFFANAASTRNTGVDIVFDYKKRFGSQHFNALLTGNIQHMVIHKINVPAKLNDTKEHQLTFLNDREQKFILASAPPAKFGFNAEYGINKISAGVKFTYFGKIDLYGYGSGSSFDLPVVPTDADANVYVPDEYIYGGKVTTDVYASYKINKQVSLYIGSDNIFNVHPDLGAVQAAKEWCFNNETGGPWDAVQMGDNGRRFFARIAFNF